MEVYHIKLPITPILTNNEVLKRARPIDRHKRVSGTPFIPHNDEKLELFKGHWCHKCCHEDKTRAKYCEIATSEMLGEQPSQWVYVENKPICTEWEARK